MRSADILVRSNTCSRQSCGSFEKYALFQLAADKNVGLRLDWRLLRFLVLIRDDQPIQLV